MNLSLTFFEQVLADTLSGVITSLPYFILIIWGVRTLVKEMPKWINQYDEIKMKHLRIEMARGLR